MTNLTAQPGEGPTKRDETSMQSGMCQDHPDYNELHENCIDCISFARLKLFELLLSN